MFDGAFPTPIDALPDGITAAEVTAIATELGEELRRQEAALLSPYPSAHPSAGAVSH